MAQNRVQQDDVWQPVFQSKAMNSEAGIRQFDMLDMSVKVKMQNEDSLLLPVPLPNGELAVYRLTYDPIMPTSLASKYPTIRTFKAVDVQNPQNVGRFDISPNGLHAMFRHNGEQIFIDPVNRTESLRYKAYSKSQAVRAGQYTKLPPIKHEHAELNLNSGLLGKQSQQNNVSRTYTIALTTTGEYASYHGGTKESVMAALTTMLNRVNQVYQQEVNITFNMIADNDQLIFLDGETDPFGNDSNDIDLIGDAINEIVNEEDYDLGHLVGTGGGGLAGLGVVCSGLKAQGLTGSAQPENDYFYIDYVSHELGHQFGAEHTFNGASGGCEGNRSGDSAYEPGSGNTIMGYAGLCGDQNTQFVSDPYFHIHSIDQINAYVQTDIGGSCGMTEQDTNAAPVVDAGADFTIPARTPFTLTGSATDSDDEQLNYAWQQYDLGTETTSKSQDAQDDGRRPLFRAFEPTELPVRTFPKWSDILSGQQTHGEVLPTTTRDLTFRLVVRDLQGNVSDDSVMLSVQANNRGFEVETPANGDVWQTGENVVTWYTADTELEPVSCQNVDIYLSTDSGQSFEQVLAESVPNNGSYTVNVSDLVSDSARVKVSCSDNVFFSVSWADFRINSEGSNTGGTPEFISQKTISINEDESAVLSLNDLSFSNDVDTLNLFDGENYTVDGTTITPDADYFGLLTVRASVNAGDSESNRFNILVNVTQVNDAPIARGDDVTIVYSTTATTIDVLDNDIDVDNEALTIVNVSYSGTGTVEVSNGTLRYTANASFEGNETIEYTIEDGAGLQSTATVSVKVINSQIKEETKTTSSSGGSMAGLLIGLFGLVFRRLGQKVM
jgi:acid phosphatase class B